MALGAAIGLLYDFFRILRVRLRLPLLGSVLDLLFWLAVTAAIFVYAVAAGNGEVRIYMLLSILGGAVLYFLLLSRWALKLGYLLADFLGLLWKIGTRAGPRCSPAAEKNDKNCKKMLPLSEKVV